MIKNEHVSDLFRKSLIDNGWEDQLKEAIFEPKMTRSRVKEVIQNGNVSFCSKCASDVLYQLVNLQASLKSSY